MDEGVAAVVGAACGAVFTAGATWWVSGRLDRQRERRLLMAAIEVVAAEIHENRDRIVRLQEAGLSSEEVGGKLTLHDWVTHKATIASLWARNEPLWDEVVETYGTIHDAKGGGDMLPDVERMAALEQRLIEEQATVRREVGAFGNLGQLLRRR